MLAEYLFLLWLQGVHEKAGDIIFVQYFYAIHLSEVKFLAFEFYIQCGLLY